MLEEEQGDIVVRDNLRREDAERLKHLKLQEAYAALEKKTQRLINAQNTAPPRT